MRPGRVPCRMILAAAVLVAAGTLGCSRGQPRESRPVVIIPDLEFQPKYKAQGESPLFTDGRAMRTPPEGTVARGTLKEDVGYWNGKVGETYLAHNPRPVTAELLLRGQNRFNIYCSPCHDRAGTGKGIVVASGLVPPPTFHDPRLVSVTDGYLFEVMTQGVRTMPSYAAQVTADDRWAIVAYLRAIQRSHRATLADVPPEARKEIE